MSGPNQKGGYLPRTAMPAFGAFGNQQPASLLFEKSNPGLRRSTPDSEALASSDDEIDQGRAAPSAANPKVPKPTRRTSWLNDVPTATASLNRKASGTMPYSPSGSNPGTPSAEQPVWAAMSNSAAAAWNNTVPSAGASPWGSIWSQDARKEPTSRLQEVMTSENQAGIPFQIPLQPTPKAYRSQSYSVGQKDHPPGEASSGTVPTSTDANRSRMANQYPSLQRRTSRTAGLGVLDATGLGRLREDDDEDHAYTPDSAGNYTSNQALMIAKLEQENAQLRAAQHRPGQLYPSNPQGFRGPNIPGSVPEELDNAVDDHESMSSSGLLQRRDNANAVRRMSENALATYDRQSQVEIDTGKPQDGTRRPLWQTSLGFGTIPEAPHSRRHSLADVPTRHGSIGSQDEGQPAQYYSQMPQDPSQSNDPAYFPGDDSTRRAADEHVKQSYLSNSPYGLQYVPPGQPLHIVNFKCCRSDVYYVQDGTGLDVHVGDLVIVDADRGIDLGTVQHTNVTWDTARRYKDHYAEEHYKWLMMFSNQSRNGGPNVINPNGPQPRSGSAVGGMGPSGHGGHDGPHQEIKPRLIKRLAANHEIMALKEKEGNEAKAKRVCANKAQEHRLNMEILDAEFQLDNKKLTFFYFADTYINFNSLVTDLFKVYKTRIWMSAINPASFQTPTASLGLTPATLPHGYVPDRDSPGGRNRQHGGGQRHQQQNPPLNFDPSYDNERGFVPNFAPFPPELPPPGLSPFGNGNMNMPQWNEFYPQSYQMLNPNAPNFATGRPPDMRSRGSNHSPANDWAGRFQGLSLGS